MQANRQVFLSKYNTGRIKGADKGEHSRYCIIRIIIFYKTVRFFQLFFQPGKIPVFILDSIRHCFITPDKTVDDVITCRCESNLTVLNNMILVHQQDIIGEDRIEPRVFFIETIKPGQDIAGINGEKILFKTVNRKIHFNMGNVWMIAPVGAGSKQKKEDDKTG